MRNELICEIATREGLEYIETTTGTNGYPESIRGAIIGFDTYDQAKEIADKYGFDIELFKTRYGWQFWERCGWMPNPMKISSEDYGDNYSQYNDVDDVLSRLKDELPYMDSIDEIIAAAENAREIIDEINDCKPGEIVITCHGRYYETVAEETMRWDHDSKIFTIGLISKD